MPKAFSEDEKINILNTLHDAAKHCLKTYGAKKTTIDELVQKTHIAKGTFYMFYPSKEHLFYDLFRKEHDFIQDDFLHAIAKSKELITPEYIADTIFDLYKSLNQSFLFNFMTQGDLEYVLRKLPKEVLIDHQNRDDDVMENFIKHLPQVSSEKAPLYSASLRLLFTSILHKEDVGEEIFDEAFRFSIYAVISQIFKEKKRHD